MDFGASVFLWIYVVTPDILLGSDEAIRPVNFYRHWYRSRRGVPEKLVNLKYIKKFGDVMEGHISPHRIEWEEKVAEFRYTGGYANFHLMRFSKGLYIDNFPTWGLYKDAPADEAIHDHFLSLGNDRYGQHAGVFEKQRPYVLFALQMTARKDFKETLRYIRWATESKTYTLFKTHPCAGGGTDYTGLWRFAEQHGLLSEYTVLIDGCQSKELVEGADRFVSVDSGLTFKAMLLNKPVCTLRGPTMMNDVVPHVATDDSILDVKAVPYKDKLKWLNWFYHRVCTDFHKEDYADRLLHRLSRYEDEGLNDYEVHKW